MSRRRSVGVIGLVVALLPLLGCGGMRQLREENETLRQEVARLQQVEADYGDKLREAERLSDEEKGKLRAEMSDMRERLHTELQEQIRENNALVGNLRDLTVIEVGEAALFASGQADLTPKGQQVVRKMIDVLKRFPDYHIRVEGHTDAMPIGSNLKSRFASNWELSTARATTVVKYMIHGLGADPGRLQAVGFSKYRPIAGNDSREGRAKNRRIRLVVFKAVRPQAPESAP